MACFYGNLAGKAQRGVGKGRCYGCLLIEGVSAGGVYLRCEATSKSETGQGVVVGHDDDSLRELSDGPAVVTNEELL